MTRRDATRKDADAAELRALPPQADEIAAIDPTLLPKPPVSPFSGQAFRMERRDGQLLVYSVGPNRKDEHGVVAPTQMKAGPDDFGTGAWDVALRRQPPGSKAENPDRSSAPQ